jgi:uncharacterized protein (DUF2267 family)
MSATGLEVFDSTLQKTNAWLREIMDELATEDRHFAYSALRVTLHALRDRLTVNEAADLGAQLPMLIRGLYYEGWQPSGKPDKTDLGEFLMTIRNHVGRGLGDPDPRKIAQAVFRVVALHVTSGELDDVKHCLPADLRELWS